MAKLGDLPKELLVDLCSRFLDPASSFSLSLTSTSFRSSLSSPPTSRYLPDDSDPSNSYSPLNQLSGYEFSRLAALEGYAGLLSYAYSLGCPFHPSLANIFAKKGDIEMIRWMLSLPHQAGKIFSTAGLIAASKSGNQELTDFILEHMSGAKIFDGYDDVTMDFTGLLFSSVIPYVAFGGHADLVAHYDKLYNSPEPAPFGFLSRLRVVGQACSAGHFALAQSYFRVPNNPSDQELFECMSLSLEANQFEIVKYALDKGIQITGRFGAKKFIHPNSIPVARLLIQKEPQFYKQYLERAYEIGSLPFFKFACDELEKVFTKEDILQNFLHHSESAKTLEPNDHNKIECMKFLMDKFKIDSLTGEPVDLKNWRFLDVEQLQWLEENGVRFSPSPIAIDHLQYRLDKGISLSSQEIHHLVLPFSPLGRTFRTYRYLSFAMQRGCTLPQNSIIDAAQYFDIPLLQFLFGKIEREDAVSMFRRLWIADVLKGLESPTPMFNAALKTLSYLLNEVQYKVDDDERAQIEEKIVSMKITNSYFIREVRNLLLAHRT